MMLDDAETSMKTRFKQTRNKGTKKQRSKGAKERMNQTSKEAKKQRRKEQHCPTQIRVADVRRCILAIGHALWPQTARFKTTPNYDCNSEIISTATQQL